MLRVVFSILFALLLACPIHAGEINVLGGYGATNNPVETTGAWQVRYMEGLGEHFAYCRLPTQLTFAYTRHTGPDHYGL